MEKHSVDAIVGALNMANVRYLVAGGLAVVAHGYLRFTADVDLIVDLEPANVMRAVASLERLGYRPRAPVAHALTEIDLFVEPPLDFETAYRDAVRKEVAPGVAATFIGIQDLRRLKQRAGRPQDLLDLEKLKWLDTETRDE